MTDTAKDGAAKPATNKARGPRGKPGMQGERGLPGPVVDLADTNRKLVERIDALIFWLKCILGVVIACGLLLLGGAGINVYNGLRINKAVTKIDDCTGANPNSECRRQQAKDSTPVLAQLNLNVACSAAFYAGRTPPACSEVDAALRSLDAGQNPFAPTTTTVVKHP